MINVVHTKQGRSFKGLVAYLLEGSKGQENPERVAWTQALNLATQRPKTVASVMAATALNQDRLKDSAGIKKTGRKSSNHVLHYTLSWAEGQTVSREEVMRAVNGSLAVLGEKAGAKGGKGKKKGRVAIRDQFASEHQVLVVAHRDTEHVHCHIVVNRVHPRHGVMLPSSNDFKRLSRWAERYERETGGLIIDTRAINNAARDREESVPGKKRVPRDVYELEAVANDNRPAALQLKSAQRAGDAALAKDSAKQRAQRKLAWQEMETNHQARKRALRDGTAQRVTQARRAARDNFSKDWATLHYEHRASTAAFDRNEKQLAGKAINALKALLSLKAPVNVLWSQGARKHVLENAQEAQRSELASRQRQAEKEAERSAKSHLQSESLMLGHRFNRERAELMLKHRIASMALRAKWKTRESERKQAWEEHLKATEVLPPEKRFGAQMIEPDQQTRKALGSLERMREAAKKRDQDRADSRDDGRER